MSHIFFREFIQKSYVPIKKENPNFPILIRECSGIQPCIWARYGLYYSYKIYVIFLKMPLNYVGTNYSVKVGVEQFLYLYKYLRCFLIV